LLLYYTYFVEWLYSIAHSSEEESRACRTTVVEAQSVRTHQKQRKPLSVLHNPAGKIAEKQSIGVYF